LAKYLALNAGKYNFTRLQKAIFKRVVFQKRQLNLTSLVSSPFVSSGDEIKDEVFVPSIPFREILGAKKKKGNEKFLSALNNTAVLSYHVRGVKLELAGRLTTQRSIPRKTVDNAHTGSFTVSQPGNGLHSQLDFSQYTSKNKLGAFTLKV